MIKAKATKNMFLSYETNIKEFRESIIKVGLPEKTGGAIHDGTKLTVAQLGAIHEFGVPEQNIPKRSFIREPIINSQKYINNLIKVKFSQVSGNAMSPKMALDQIGLGIAEVCRKSFTKNNWEKNSDITINGGWITRNGKRIKIKGKKSNRPLIDSGDLRKAVTYTVEKI